MNKINQDKNNLYWKLLSPLVLFVLTVTSMITWADSSGGRPGTTPELEIPGAGIFRPYVNPTCASNMHRSDVEVTNNETGGTHWYFYTCTFRNDGWCSTEVGHHKFCPEKVCHPYTDWIGPWDNQQGTYWQPNLGEFYTCISIGTPYPF